MKLFPIIAIAAALIPYSQRVEAQTKPKEPSYIWHNKDGSKTFRFDYPAANGLPRRTEYERLSAEQIRNIKRLKLVVDLAGIGIELGGRFIDVNSDKISDLTSFFSNLSFESLKGRQFARNVLEITTTNVRRGKEIGVPWQEHVLEEKIGKEPLADMSKTIRDSARFPNKANIGKKYTMLQGTPAGAPALIVVDSGAAVFGYYVGESSNNDLSIGDVILAVDGEPISPTRSFYELLNTGPHQNDQKRAMIVKSKHGRVYDIEVETEKLEFTEGIYNDWIVFLSNRQIGAFLELDAHKTQVTRFGWIE